MTKSGCLFIIILNVFLCINIKAQNPSIKKLNFYGALTHQHQDFFNKPFSFTGFEAGATLHNKLIFGLYGSTFLSKLEVKITNRPMLLHIMQGGVVAGRQWKINRVVQGGCLLNVGYFSLLSNSSDFSVLTAGRPLVKINGLLLSPQAFAQFRVIKWMKLRLGLAYSLYSFKDQPLISKNHLQNISVCFGFIFGKF